jgi:hypothetical protein
MANNPLADNDTVLMETIKGLARLGITLSPGTTTRDFLPRLHAAVTALAAGDDQKTGAVEDQGTYLSTLAERRRRSIEDAMPEGQARLQKAADEFARNVHLGPRAAEAPASGDAHSRIVEEFAKNVHLPRRS